MERFGFMNERIIPTPVLLSDLRGLPLFGCGCSIVVRVCMIGGFACQLRNIPPFYASAVAATTSFVFGIRLGWDSSFLVWVFRWLVGDR